MSSDSYGNKNNPGYAETNNKVSDYFKKLYPGYMGRDASGKMTEPNQDYDMTEEEFNDAQAELDAGLEEEIAEIEDDMNSDGTDNFDASQYVELQESIPVRVMHADGTITDEALEIYGVELPEGTEDGGEDKPGDDEEIYVWSDDGDCEICSEMAGTILDDESIPAPHPNCNCTAVKMTRKEYADEYGDPDPEKQEKYELLKVQEKMREIKDSSSKVVPVDIDNIKELKKALTDLGFYKPDMNQGESLINMNEYPDSRLTDAIKEFQSANGLKPDGLMEKGSATEHALISKYEFNGFTFQTPVNTDKNQVAVFDGKSLSIYDGKEKIASWAGVSGRPGFQTPEYQSLKSTGPLPEGAYVVRQDRFQERKDYNIFRQQTSWPGGADSWGDSRVWLEPSRQTFTYNRSGFSIHGGKEPGSAGCIDLTSSMKDFSDWFENNKKDVIIYVKY